MSKIISIGTASPQYQTQQEKILEFMQASYDNERTSRKLNVLFRYSGISQRYSVIPDFNKSLSRHYLFNGNEIPPKVEERLDIFKENALPLALSAINRSFEEIDTNISEFGITHLITVTCTGLYAPGLDAELIEALNLPNDIFHTAVNFLGCNAAFHALKIADLITKSDKNAKVLIVSVELCTLHFQPKNNHDNLLSNTIFGDGAAAVIVVPETPDYEPIKGLKIKGFYSLLLNKGKEMMGWNITPVNFEMILDAKIPELIGDEINDVVTNVCEKLNIESDKIENYAIHPGGKKILDTIKAKLQLSDEDMEISYKILKEYGNMSSPTILFILNELMQKNKKDETIFAIGFGPGLSIESALLTYA